ncbi:MAG TPA: hypothetical protein DEP84_07450 [Chloroflexi bacterium]|nr:hypothetical protein [Chloroflexota bacterium]
MRKQLKRAALGALFLLAGLILCLVIVLAAGWMQNREANEFRTRYNIGADASIDKFVVDQFTPGMDREQVHETMQRLAPARFYGYKKDPDGLAAYIESVDLRIGRTTKRTYLLSYDERGKLKRIIAVD